MNIYVLGVATHPPSRELRHLRLEEIGYNTSRAALQDAGVGRAQLDNVTIAAADELDGRPLSSMLMAAPVGSYLKDEIKVTDSGATALCLAGARIMSGGFDLGLVVSWCKSSKTDVEAVMRFRGDPFFCRPLGMNMLISDALFAQAVSEEYEITSEEVDRRVVRAYERASDNPRGMRFDIPEESLVMSSELDATPLKNGHRAPLTDGAAALVLASEHWVSRHPDANPLACIAGLGWATDSYRLGADRLRRMNSARVAWEGAMQQAGLEGADDIDLIELESQTGYHEAAYVRAFVLPDDVEVSPSGGPFAQNPLFCSGLVNAVEAVLQVSGRAGAVQVPGARRAMAHGCHGYAQQGNVVVVFEATGRDS